MGKVLTDADFGIKGTAGSSPNDIVDNEPVMDAGDLEATVEDKEDGTVEDPSKGKGKKGKKELIFGKYENMGEAEKALKESERKMHEATERAARLERDSVRTTVSDKPEVDPADVIADEAMAEIGKLNSEDPEYQKKTARIWAKAQMKIANLSVGKAKEAETSTKSTEDRVSTALTDARLPSDNDKKIFWSLASHCPSHIKDLEEQISWTIDRVKEVKADVAKELAEETARKKKEKGDLKVLGRKGGKTTPSEEDEEENNKPPMTLCEQLKASRRKV